jgi:hypothetical protein
LIVVRDVSIDVARDISQQSLATPSLLLDFRHDGVVRDIISQRVTSFPNAIPNRL